MFDILCGRYLRSGVGLGYQQLHIDRQDHLLGKLMSVDEILPVDVDVPGEY